jgi:arabinofuranan 3-O-arabinosyltransferase
VDWLGDRRELTVGSGTASYLTTYENYNDGWKATLNGKELSPVRLDGWQQAWRVPAGAGGTIKLSYTPATTYEAGLIGSGAAAAVLLALVIWRRHEPNPDEPQSPPPLPGLWLGTVALTLVGAVIAGWFALLVPALALLAYRRHALLVPIAFVALAGAGIVAATGAGDPVGAGEGAFSRAAQLLALIGLFAGLVSVRERRDPETPDSTLVLPPSSTPLPQRERGTSAMGEQPGGEGRPSTWEELAGRWSETEPEPDTVEGPGAIESGPTISARGPGHGESQPTSPPGAPEGARGRDISGSAARARPAPTDPHQKDDPR